MMGRHVRAAVARFRLVRMLVKSRAIQRIIITRRAARELPLAFLGGELCRQRGRYRVRRGVGVVCLRHRSRDIEIFTEVFSRLSYDADLEGPLSVLDVGGNIGLFGVFALSRWQVRQMRSFEPDPGNAALLAETIAANDNASWTLERAAVSNEHSTSSFTAGRFADGFLSRDGDIQVPVLDLFEQRAPDLLKIDIEGGEWPILTDPRLATFGAETIVLEWHTRQCPSGDPHWLAQTSLEGAGYVVTVDRPSEGGHVGLMWAIRERGRPRQSRLR
jgi:FkbM family methyltransferase